jgi:uncharacterized protein YkwD
MTKSLTEGILCNDNYNDANSPSSQKKDSMTITEIRAVLLKEHNIRRKNRGLVELIASEKLNTIAQKYALKLCQAGEISHALNGSTLSERYDEGGYDYQL